MTKWADPPPGAKSTDRAVACFKSGRPTPCGAMSIADTQRKEIVEGMRAEVDEYWSGTMADEEYAVRDVKRGEHVWLQFWNNTKAVQVSQLTLRSEPAIAWFIAAAKKFADGTLSKTDLEIDKRIFLKTQKVAKKPAGCTAKKPAAKRRDPAPPKKMKEDEEENDEDDDDDDPDDAECHEQEESEDAEDEDADLHDGDGTDLRKKPASIATEAKPAASIAQNLKMDSMTAQKPAAVANVKKPAGLAKLMKKPVGKRSVKTKMVAPAEEEDDEEEDEEEEVEEEDDDAGSTPPTSRRDTSNMPVISMPSQLTFDDASKSGSDDG